LRSCNIILISGEWENYHRKGFYTALKKKRPDDEMIIIQYPVSVIINLFFSTRKLFSLLKNFGKLIHSNNDIKKYLPWILTHSTFWISNPLARFFDTMLLSSQINKVIDKYYKNYNIKLWLYNPEHYFLINKIKHDFIIYDYYDNYSYDINGNKNEKMDFYNTENIKSSDMVVATAELMYENALQYNKNTAYITNASNASFMSTEKQPDKADKEADTIVYAGAIKDWIDFDLLFFVMDNLSDVRFVFLGYVERNSRKYFKRLKKYKNFEFLGMKPPEEVFEILNRYSVGIIPFRITELTKGVMPIKFFDYIEANMSIVCTALPELAKFSGSIFISDNKEEFLENCKKVLNGIQNNDDIYKTIIMDNDWTNRAELYYKKFKNFIGESD
jgi:hypothetical protein